MTAVAARPTLAPHYHVLFALGILATIIDATLTYLAVGVWHLAEEANPLLVPIVSAIGIGWTMVIRAAFGLTMLGLLYWRFSIKLPSKFSRGGLWFVTFALVGVCVYNAILALIRFPQ